jgi:hypothetical protein
MPWPAALRGILSAAVERDRVSERIKSLGPLYEKKRRTNIKRGSARPDFCFGKKLPGDGQSLFFAEFGL